MSIWRLSHPCRTLPFKLGGEPQAVGRAKHICIKPTNLRDWMIGLRNRSSRTIRPPPGCHLEGNPYALLLVENARKAETFSVGLVSGVFDESCKLCHCHGG